MKNQSIEDSLVKMFETFEHLFMNYVTITNYVLIIYERTNFYYVLGVVSQIRVCGRNGTHGAYANVLAR